MEPSVQVSGPGGQRLAHPIGTPRAPRLMQVIGRPEIDLPITQDEETAGHFIFILILLLYLMCLKQKPFKKLHTMMAWGK